MKHVVSGTLALVVVMGCTRVDPEEVQLRHRVRDLEAQRDQLATELSARRFLAGWQPNQGVILALAPSELAGAYQSALPAEFDAGSLAREVSGTIVVESIRDARVEGDQLKFTATGKGRNLKLNVSVPPPYDAMARELIDGLQAGLDMRMRGRLVRGNGGVVFHGHCEGARLHKHAKDDYHGMIKDAVNDRILNHGYPVSISSKRNGVGGWNVRGVFPAQGKLIIVAGSDQPAAGGPPPPPRPAPTPTPSPPPSPTPPGRPAPGPVAGAPPRAPSPGSEPAFCAAVLEQLALCREQSADMLLDERARGDARLAGIIARPEGRKAERESAMRGLDGFMALAPAQREQRCTQALRRLRGAAPPYAAARSSATACFDRPCRDRAACLRGFVAQALSTTSGDWLR